MGLVSPYLSIITLNVNGLNSPIKRHKVAGWNFFKKTVTICCLQKTHLSFKNTYWFKVRRRKKMLHANGNQKAEVATLPSDKIHFSPKTVK